MLMLAPTVVLNGYCNTHGVMPALVAGMTSEISSA